MSSSQGKGRFRLLAPRILAIVIALIGLVLAIGGVQLIGVGGSPYYLVTGLACLASAWFLFTGKMLGVWIFAAMLAWTLVWAIWEVGFDGWSLMPRLVGPFVIGLYMALPFNWRPLEAAFSKKAA
jgi:quinoprotein glucose dehydrogenase